jgi:phosphoserine phosphatase
MSYSNMAYPKLIFLDLEGTLLKKAIHLDDGKVAPSAWTLLAERLGPDALREEEETKERWLKGEYSSYIEWMQDTIRIHRRYGLTAKVFSEVMDSVEEMLGVRQAFQVFRERGAVTATISGGFKALADRLQRSLKIEHALSACEYFFDPHTGLLEHWNLLPTDYEIKVDFMRLIMKEYRTEKKQCVFVGDGQNDVWMAREVGFSIAFNAHPDLQRVSSYSINQPLGKENFFAVVECIDSHLGTGGVS